MHRDGVLMQHCDALLFLSCSSCIRKMKPFSLELLTIESLLLWGTEGAYPDLLALPEVF